MLVLCLLLVLIVLRRFYHRRILQPLVELTESTQHLLHGEPDIQYAYSSELSEVGDLSRALIRFQELKLELELQRRQFSEAESWYRQIIEFAPDGMLIVDDSGNIVIANPKAHEQFAYTQGELLGLSIDELVPEDIRPKHAVTLIILPKRFSTITGAKTRIELNTPVKLIEITRFHSVILVFKVLAVF